MPRRPVFDGGYELDPLALGQLAPDDAAHSAAEVREIGPEDVLPKLHRLVVAGEFERAASFDVAIANTVARADIDSLQSLVDKSLLTRTADRRFAMLETVRTFAREHLDEAELQTLRRRQLDLLEPLADQAPSWLTGSRVPAEEQAAWLDDVQALLPDIREVHKHMLLLLDNLEQLLPQVADTVVGLEAKVLATRSCSPMRPRCPSATICRRGCRSAILACIA